MHSSKDNQQRSLRNKERSTTIMQYQAIRNGGHHLPGEDIVSTSIVIQSSFKTHTDQRPVWKKKDHEEQPINEIVLPLLNVSRRLPDNTVNEKEPNQERIFMSSAGVKTSFAYDLLLDVFEDSIIHPKTSFCMGCDYRVPMMHGLLDKTYINKLKTSPSYSEEAFAREYLSIWAGSSDESWYNFDKLQKYRKIKNPETHAKFRESESCFYLL